MQYIGADVPRWISVHSRGDGPIEYWVPHPRIWLCLHPRSWGDDDVRYFKFLCAYLNDVTQLLKPCMFPHLLVIWVVRCRVSQCLS